MGMALDVSDCNFCRKNPCRLLFPRCSAYSTGREGLLQHAADNEFRGLFRVEAMRH